MLLEVGDMERVVMGENRRLLVKTKQSQRDISQRSRDAFILSPNEPCNMSLSVEL